MNTQNSGVYVYSLVLCAYQWLWLPREERGTRYRNTILYTL